MRKGPDATVEVVRKLVGAGKASGTTEAPKLSAEEDQTSQEATVPTKTSDGDAAKAEVAAEVADSAQKLDEGSKV